MGIASLGDSAINVALGPWVAVPDYAPAQGELYQAVVERFRAAGIEMPFPQREVRCTPPPERVPAMTTEENKALVRRVLVRRATRVDAGGDRRSSSRRSIGAISRRPVLIYSRGAAGNGR